ncbi:MAG: metallophosphoesterase [Bacteroidota bacterium]
MKIIAVSDIHGAYQSIESLLKRVDADLLIIAGDISTKGSDSEIRNAIEIFQLHSKNIFAICGNMDFPSTENILQEKNIDVNARGKIINDIGFFGVSGAPHSYMKTPYEISEEEIYNCAIAGYSQIQQSRMKIFLSHTPPINTNVDKINSGKHVGSSSARKFIEEMQPDICICGHIHEAFGVDKIGSTVIVNCGPANKYYVEIEIGKEIIVKQKLI